MVTEIKRWGNSAAVRLPAGLLAATGLTVNSPVIVRVEERGIVIEPVVVPQYNLEQLLAESPKDRFRLDADDRDWLDAEPMGRERVL